MSAQAKRERVRVHMAVDVAGLLRRTDRQLDGVLTINGEPASGTKAREVLNRALDEGTTVVPYGNENVCPDFDYTGGGCPGHPIEPKKESTS